LVLCVRSAPGVSVVTSPPASCANAALGVKRSSPCSVFSVRPSPIDLTMWRSSDSSATASAMMPTLACCRTRAIAVGRQRAQVVLVVFPAERERQEVRRIVR
jgi:hypothetical protein